MDILTTIGNFMAENPKIVFPVIFLTLVLIAYVDDS